MSSGFSGGGSDFYTAGGIAPGRSTIMPMNNPPQIPYRSAALAGILTDPASQIVQRRPDLMGKRSLAEFQQHQLLQLQQQQQQQQQMQQQQHGLGLYFRNVKQRSYPHATVASPISPLSPMDFSTTPEVSSISNGNSSSVLNPRYGLPILQQLRPQLASANNNNINNLSSPGVSFPNLGQNRAGTATAIANQEPFSLSSSCQESEQKMMSKLQELEKELLDDKDEGDQGEAVSVVTNSEWSETIQSLMSPNQKPISPSPTSSSSSCSSTSASPPVASPKQSMTEAASAIVEGKPEIASDIIKRLAQVSNVKGTSEQRLSHYMVSALRSRVFPTECPPPFSELYSKEHSISTQMLYEVSPCFKLGFMAANLAILEATTTSSLDQLSINKLHVIDFDIGQGGQYVHLLHALAAKRAADKPTILKITTFTDFVNRGEERLKVVGDGLRALANKVGLSLVFNVMTLKISDLSPEKLGLESDEALAVNFAFRLYKLPDESVTTENLRDELLRGVKKLSPKVVTVVEQEMNANTAPFLARVNEACGYYAALFDSLDATVSRENPERVMIEEGLGRKMANSVACEGRDRVERCEVFGKWRARLRMAGFEPKPMSQLVADSLRSKLNSGTRGNPGFTVNEQSGGICFGWMGRTLTFASAWR